MIQITTTLSISEETIQFEFIRASGPGGQHVNKVASAVQLRFDAAGAGLPAEIYTRLARLAGKRLTENGSLIIEARRYREQERNRQDALDRLVTLLQQATKKPKPRRKTKPTAASTQRRLGKKRQRGQIKQWRGPVPSADE